MIMKFEKGRFTVYPNVLHLLLFGGIKRIIIHHEQERIGKDSVFACLSVCYCESFRLQRSKNHGEAYFMLQPFLEVQI
jgi:hypothetical protein